MDEIFASRVAPRPPTGLNTALATDGPSAFTDNVGRVHEKRNLVLCFDGTGNQYRGDGTETNILKIYRMLEKDAPDQYHYYQPGIGTYVVYDGLARTDKLAALRASVAKGLDLAFGTSVSEHVLGGYKFLMRYFAPGDQIYIFGFSRGAYTARFLAEMLDDIGLLPHGNEEMVDFAWEAFSKWQRRQWFSQPKETGRLWKLLTGEKPKPKTPRTDDQGGDKAEASVTISGDLDESYHFWEYLTLKPVRDARNYAKGNAMRATIDGFKETFSRDIGNINFLGLFDTVSSVPQFDVPWMRRNKFPYAARSKATEIWHAVSIDERRVKFRPDLIYQKPRKEAVHIDGPEDARSPMSPTSPEKLDQHSHENAQRRVTEVWFAGNHGDVGGGWAPDDERLSISHVPLVWMVRAAKAAGAKFSPDQLDKEGIVLDAQDADYKAPAAAYGPVSLARAADEAELDHMMHRSVHDCLHFGGGETWHKWIFWNFLEILPIRRMELREDIWHPQSWWPSRRAQRDMPDDAKVHGSVIERMGTNGKYAPQNLLQGGGRSSLRKMQFSPDSWKIMEEARDQDYYGRVYQRSSHTE